MSGQAAVISEMTNTEKINDQQCSWIFQIIIFSRVEQLLPKIYFNTLDNHRIDVNGNINAFTIFSHYHQFQFGETPHNYCYYVHANVLLDILPRVGGLYHHDTPTWARQTSRNVGVALSVRLMIMMTRRLA